MGLCGSKDIKRKKEVIISPEGFHSLDQSITQTSKSLCKIIVSAGKISSGFLIQLFKGRKEFYCLMTNEHVITKEMIDKKIKIDIYYDSQSKYRNIELNPDERLIKEFTDIDMDVTVIEIISKDNIPKDYFLLPLIDYMNNYNELINKEISIIQYPRGEMKYSYGIIKSYEHYEFAHNANTDEGSSGSPIFLRGTTKVLGIHKSGIKTNNIKENFGDFIWPIFTYFKNYTDNKIENKEIKNNNNYYNKESKINNISPQELSKNKIENKEIKNNNNYNKPNNIFINNQNDSDKKIKNKNLKIENNYENESNINNISNIDKLNTMNIIYIIYSGEDSIKLFGKDFVNNNINNCYLLIDNKENKLCEYLELNEKQKKKNELKIKLIEKNKITNMSYMFNCCNSLKKLPGISKWNTKNVTNMSYMFDGCKSLKELPDISKWNTKNVTYMNGMFYGCSNIIISKIIKIKFNL